MLCTGNRPTLTPSLLLAAYRQGLFPMDQEGSLEWHAPVLRAIFPLHALGPYPAVAPNARFRRFMRSSGFRHTRNAAFDEVIGHCATVHGETWLSPHMVEAYGQLHRIGHAHSVETWLGDALVGGIYGVAIGGAFFGESMFSLAPNGSKAAFFHLADHLRRRGFILFDSQYANAHTVSLGAVEVFKDDFMDLLERAVDAKVAF